MKLVHTAQHPIEAEIVKGLLEEHGLRAVVLGDELQMAGGDIGLDMSALPGVWVNDEDAARALEIIHEHHEPPPADGVGEGDADTASDRDADVEE